MGKLHKSILKKELKRSSAIVIKRLSVLEKHKMIINPKVFSSQMAESAEIRKSVCGISDVKKSSLNSVASKVTSKIVRESVSQIMASQWYPNLHLKEEVIQYKMNTSPAPKSSTKTDVSSKLNLSARKTCFTKEFILPF